MIIDKPTQFFIDKRIFWIFLVLFFYLPFVGHGQALVYLFFFVLCIFGGFIIDNTENFVIKKFAFAVLIILSTLFAGFRDFGIGVDTNVYIMNYFDEAEVISSVRDFITSDFNGDKGFLLLACVSRLFSSTPQCFLVCIALFIYFFTFLSVFKMNQNRPNVCWSIFLFIWFFTLFHESLNAMRQYCAMSILLLSFVYLLNNNWRNALLLVIPAYFFHSSSIVFLLVFFFYILSFLQGRKKVILFCSFFLFCCFASIKIFDTMPFLIGSGLISDHFELYGTDSVFDAKNLFGPSFMVMFCVILYAIWKLYKNGDLSDQMLMLAIGIHSFVFVFRLTALSVVYLNRIASYFFYCDMLLLSVILTKNVLPNELKILLYLCVVYMWYNGYILHPGGETYPYRSSLLGITGG